VFSGPARELCSEWSQSAALGLEGEASSRERVALCWKAGEQVFSGPERGLCSEWPESAALAVGRRSEQS
jgi:hypothetical protein